ncbi:TonB-dependent receptor [Novosphingobium sp.]|uniref:TonB-dependent receptor n=1 Tax=Novosphingobium sp. TaxID=1874826 RepID=UPI003B518A23
MTAVLRLARLVLLGGVSTVAIGAVTPGAFAQQAAAQQAAPDITSTNAPAPSEIIVTGLRGSLQRSLDIKKNAVGVIDAISAEDIGKFPDSNLAAAVQRIPGISVSRGASSLGGLPTSTGDATEITVRGFGPTFNETLYDGRQASTGTSNRGFDFSAVGSDFVSEVDILKTPDATLSSGAIGATINIKYPKPFDHPGLRASASFSGKYSPDAKSVTPNGGALISDTFANNTIGILADFAYSDKKTRQNHVNIQGWEGNRYMAPGQFADPAAAMAAGFTDAGAKTNPPSNPASWVIQDYGVYQEHTEDKRIDGRLVLQWRPSDSIEMTLNDDYSRDHLSQQQYGYSVWFNASSLTGVERNANGTLTNFSQANTPTDFQSQINSSVIVNNEVGFNTKWTVSPKFNVVLDLDRAESQLNPKGELSSLDVDVGYGPSSPNGINGTNVGIAGVAPGSLPYPTGIGPNGNAAMFINNGLIGSHVLPITSQQNKDVVTQGKLEGAWSEDTLKIKFGVQYVNDKKNLSEYDTFANNDWQAYAGYGPASNNPGGVALPQNLFTNSFSTANFINGFKNGGNLPANILAFNPYSVLNYLQGLGNPQTKVIPGANTACCIPAFDGIYRTAPNTGSFQTIEESTASAFLNINDETRVGDMPLKINMGLRFEQTTTRSSGLATLPVLLTIQSSDHTAFQVKTGDITPVTSKNVYRYLLPNLDLVLSATDHLKIRFDASRTLTRPPLNLLTPVLNIGATQRLNSLNATGGNPNLQPYLSDNLDLGAEWYYAANSYISLAAYGKQVSNFIIGGTTRQTINNVIDPTTGQPGQFSVTTNINGPSAAVYGLEGAIQHVFGKSGFGAQVNGTLVGTNKPYDKANTDVSNFAVTGLANSVNAVAFFDKYGFQARVAVNWRADYLDHFGQQQNNSAFGSEPTFVNANTQVDFSTSYDVNKHLNVYFEALNLNNSTYSTHGRFKEQVLDVVKFGRSFTFGVHMKL